MRCPNCGERMEGETMKIVTQIKTVSGKVKVTHAPSGHYYCQTCDAEWVWFGRRRALRKIDGADFSEELEVRSMRFYS